MPSPRTRRAVAAALALGALTAGAPAVAGAATVTVTGDDGNPVAVPAGAPPTIRNMKPDVGVAFPPGEGRYRLTVTNAAGAAVSSGADCFSRGTLGPFGVNYTGNGSYVVTVTSFARDDFKCATPQSTESFAFVIEAFTVVTQPTAPFLLRAPSSFTPSTLALPLLQNPGADTLEVRFAPNATLAPDRAIVGNSTKTSADPNAIAQLRFQGPGVYTVVARPTRFTSAGEIGGPWSAPVKVFVAAPFDVSGGLQFLDSRGPSYSVRIKLREKSARGRVSIALARGTKGGKYRSIGSARISALATVAKRFRVTRAGTYRLRFTFKGSQTTFGGRVTYPIRITRRFTSG